MLSTERLSTESTLPEARAGTMGFRPKDGAGPPPQAGRNGERDFRDRTRSNDTHAPTGGSDAQTHREGPGREAKPRFLGHALMEHRSSQQVAHLNKTIKYYFFDFRPFRPYSTNQNWHAIALS